MWGLGRQKRGYYHISATYLPAGAILQPEKYVGHDDHILLVAQQALDSGVSALRLLNLVDDLIRYSQREKGQAWPESIDFPAIVNEVILERVRERAFADRPRRIGGVFLLASIDHAERFRAEERGGGGVIVECSAESARTFEADGSLIRPPNLHGNIQQELAQAEQRAHDYWSGDLRSDARVEVIAEGEVEVIHTLEATA
ncbi:MAG: hypothetical protein IIB21_01830 [Chloroflexi bacterium]|nr:hypothetical protein [Chloroflexota bacterium]